MPGQNNQPGIRDILLGLFDPSGTGSSGRPIRRNSFSGPKCNRFGTRLWRRRNLGERKIVAPLPSAKMKDGLNKPLRVLNEALLVSTT